MAAGQGGSRRHRGQVRPQRRPRPAGRAQTAPCPVRGAPRLPAAPVHGRVLLRPVPSRAVVPRSDGAAEQPRRSELRRDGVSPAALPSAAEKPLPLFPQKRRLLLFLEPTTADADARSRAAVCAAQAERQGVNGGKAGGRRPCLRTPGRPHPGRDRWPEQQPASLSAGAWVLAAPLCRGSTIALPHLLDTGLSFLFLVLSVPLALRFSVELHNSSLLAPLPPLSRFLLGFFSAFWHSQFQRCSRRACGGCAECRVAISLTAFVRLNRYHLETATPVERDGETIRNSCFGFRLSLLASVKSTKWSKAKNRRDNYCYK